MTLCKVAAPPPCPLFLLHSSHTQHCLTLCYLTVHLSFQSISSMRAGRGSDGCRAPTMWDRHLTLNKLPWHGKGGSVPLRLRPVQFFGHRKGGSAGIHSQHMERISALRFPDYVLSHSELAGSEEGVHAEMTLGALRRTQAHEELYV